MKAASATPQTMPTQIRSTPTSAPYEAMTRSQQAHINELVQKNRTLELSNKRLEEDVNRERELGEEALQRALARWRTESQDFKDGCESLNSFNRIMQLRTTVQLEQERISTLEAVEAARRVRLVQLQKEYRLTMSEASEAELRAKIDKIEDTLDSHTERQMEMVNELKERMSEVAIDLKVKSGLLAEAEKARDIAKVRILNI
jgi:hypothetical protein